MSGLTKLFIPFILISGILTISKFTYLLAPFVSTKSGVLSCASHGLVAEKEIISQQLSNNPDQNIFSHEGLPQSDWKEDANQNVSVKIPIKEKSSTINSIDRLISNKITEGHPDCVMPGGKNPGIAGKDKEAVSDMPTHRVSHHPGEDVKGAACDDVRKADSKVKEKEVTPLRDLVPHEIDITEEMLMAEKESGKVQANNLPVGERDKRNLNHTGLVHLDLGKAYAEKGLIDKAIQEFQNAVEANPHHLESHVQLGTAYGLKGMTNEALYEFKKAIDMDLGEAVAKIAFTTSPADTASKKEMDLAAAHINLGNAYMEEEKAERAQSEYEKVLSLKPEHPIARQSLSELYYGIGNSHLEKKEYDSAVCVFNRVLEMNPDFPQIKDALEKAHYNLGVNHANNGEFNKAIIEFNKIMEINSDYAMPGGKNPGIAGKDKEAVSDMRVHRFSHLPGKDVNDGTGSDERREDYKEERKDVRPFLEPAPYEIDVTEEMLMAERDIAGNTDNNNTEGTYITWEEINDERPANDFAEDYTYSDGTFSYYVTRIHKTEKGYNEAIRKYEDATIRYPYDNNVFLNLANAYYSKAMYLDDAIASREDAPEGDQPFSVKRYYLGNDAGNNENVISHDRSGSMDLSQEMFKDIIEYKNALRVNPDSSKALYRLAFSFSRKSSYLDVALLKSKYILKSTLSGF